MDGKGYPPDAEEVMFSHSLKLSQNFYLGEFLVSASHPELMRGVLLSDYQIDKLFYLCQWVLQPVRNEFGRVVIGSGYRPKSVNDLLPGSSPMSQHMYGEAADFVCPDVEDMLTVYKWIVNQRFPGEVIYYRGLGHCHVALPGLFIDSNQFIKGEDHGVIQV